MRSKKTKVSYRCSVSLPCEVFFRARLLAKKRGKSLASIIETMIRDACERDGVPEVPREEGRRMLTRARAGAPSRIEARDVDNLPPQVMEL